MKVKSETFARDVVARDMVAKALEGVKLELMAETYNILKSSIRVSNEEIRTVFAEWNRGELADPLLAAAADLLGLRDEDGDPLLEKVLDVAGGSEPCRAASALALELGIPAPLMSQAAFAFSLSMMKDERVDASAVLTGPKAAPTGDRKTMIEELRKALLASFILAYAEAYSLAAAAEARVEGAATALAGDSSPLAAVAAQARSRCGVGESLLLDARMKSSLDPALGSLRRVCSRCMDGGLHAPALLAAVSYYDGYRSTWLPTNLVVALRDAREGSGYERVDRPRGEIFHSDWK